MSDLLCFEHFFIKDIDRARKKKGLAGKTGDSQFDYDAEGNILVEGAKMANDTFKAIGWASAFLIGWLLERNYVKFPTDISLPKRFARCFTGMIGFYIVSLVNVPLVKMWFSSPFGTMLSCFVQMFYISFLFPWLFMKLEKPDE